MRVALDVTVGNAGATILREWGHEIVSIAEPGEPDRAWFQRAIRRGVQVVIAMDVDLEILCYDNCVEFFRHRQGESGMTAAIRFCREAMILQR